MVRFLEDRWYALLRSLCLVRHRIDTEECLDIVAYPTANGLKFTTCYRYDCSARQVHG